VIETSKDEIARMVVTCPERHGIVAAISTFLLESGANIVTSDRYSTDPEGGMFFLRMTFRLEGLRGLSPELKREFGRRVAEPFAMEWLDADIVAVVSNHPDLARDVGAFDVGFHHVPVTSSSKPEAKAEMLDILGGRVDLVVLARYMQILSGSFLDQVGAPVINIHHSFLPAFVGADPYARARERGVKLIGATAHYVTEDRDQGPIIEQDVARVSHGDDAADLERIGRETSSASSSQGLCGGISTIGCWSARIERLSSEPIMCAPASLKGGA
jgi:formyltetrahydrofolate deformylase